MTRRTGLLAAILAVASIGAEPLTPEQATVKMRERTAERERVMSHPDVVALAVKVKSLESQLAAAKARNSELSQQLTAMVNRLAKAEQALKESAPPPLPKNVAEFAAVEKRLKGMPISEAHRLLCSERWRKEFPLRVQSSDGTESVYEFTTDIGGEAYKIGQLTDYRLYRYRFVVVDGNIVSFTRTLDR